MAKSRKVDSTAGAVIADAAPEPELVLKNTAIGESVAVAAITTQRVTQGGDYVITDDGVLVKTR